MVVRRIAVLVERLCSLSSGTNECGEDKPMDQMRPLRVVNPQTDEQIASGHRDWLQHSPTPLATVRPDSVQRPDTADV